MLTRCRMRRRSVSSFVSPGPRVPMPPPSLDKASLENERSALQLRQLDLELPFFRPRASGEDIQDQLRAIQDFAVYRFLDVAKLCRAQLVVEDHDVRPHFVARHRQAFELSAPEKCRRVRLRALLHDAKHHIRTGGRSQAGQFIE